MTCRFKSWHGELRFRISEGVMKRNQKEQIVVSNNDFETCNVFKKLQSLAIKAQMKISLPSCCRSDLNIRHFLGALPCQVSSTVVDQT